MSIYPLADCTAAVDNAENIINSHNYSAGKTIRATSAPWLPPTVALNNGSPLPEDPKYNDVGSVGRYGRSTISIDATPTKNARTMPSCYNHQPYTPLSFTSISNRNNIEGSRREDSLPATLMESMPAVGLRKTPTDGRHDPYGPRLWSSPCSAESSFYACYSQADNAPYVGSQSLSSVEASNSPSLDVSGVTTTPSAVSLVPLPASGRHAHRANAKASAFSGSPERTLSPQVLFPLQSQEAPSRRSDCTVASLGIQKHTQPQRWIRSPSSPTPGSRVVRTVVSCDVDRTSGRPIPVALAK